MNHLLWFQITPSPARWGFLFTIKLKTMLQNNNQSMQTVVETFIIEETGELIYDNETLQKWKEKVEQLGLEGQKEIVVKQKSPIPFMWMNEALIATFDVLCPTKVLVEKYNKTPIPLEILDLIALSKKEEYFFKIEIWYNEKDKDPVCIGFAENQENSNDNEWYMNYYAKKYLLGRWADVKASLDSLTNKARNMFITKSVNDFNQLIRDYQRKIEDIENTANIMFGGAMPTTNLPNSLSF